jgi:gamma-butyrobetaine hydroxylase
MADGLPFLSGAQLLDDGTALEVMLNGKPYRFHAMWLRDNAQDAGTRSPGNGQRLITLLDIPPNVHITQAARTAVGLSIRFEPEGKVVEFDPAWLFAHRYDRPSPVTAGWTNDEITRWDASVADRIPVEDYETVRADPAARLRWLKAIQRYGVARLRGLATDDGAPERVADLFGYVRETNYGRVFDVRVEVDPTNLAYTNLGLQAHTDNPYRDPAPGLQILCCLRNEVEGGESIVVDGFEVARRLNEKDPRGFALLSRYNARFDYAGTQGVRLRSKRPIIELGTDGELLGIRFNNRSAAPFVDIPYGDMPDYYDAYRRMAELIDDPALALRFKLDPGEAFVVDNLRTLHARTAITSSGARHLRGCYADRDGLLSTIAAIEKEGASA